MVVCTGPGDPVLLCGRYGGIVNSLEVLKALFVDQDDFGQIRLLGQVCLTVRSDKMDDDRQFIGHSDSRLPDDSSTQVNRSEKRIPAIKG